MTWKARNINVRGKKRLCLMMQMLGRGATNVTKKRVSLTSGHERSRAKGTRENSEMLTSILLFGDLWYRLKDSPKQWPKRKKEVTSLGSWSSVCVTQLQCLNSGKRGHSETGNSLL